MRRPWRAPLYRTRFEQPFLRSIALYDVEDSVRRMKTRSRLLDVSGDGRPDHILVDPSGATTVSLNTGHNFAVEQPLLLDRPAARAILAGVGGDALFDRGFDGEFVDINGDGLPDQVVAGGSLGGAGPPADATEIRFNVGTGFQHGAGIGQLAIDARRQRVRQFGATIYEMRRFQMPGDPILETDFSAVLGVSRALADFNGDEVMDVLRTNEVSAAGEKDGEAVLEVYYGLGDGSFMRDPEQWPMPVFTKLNALKEFLQGTPGNTVNDLRDVNGDGFPDRIALDSARKYEDLRVYLHPGSRLRLTSVTPAP
jgi:hypothetical protein